MCDRVAILNKGQLVTVSSVAQLRRRTGAAGGVVVRVANPSAKLATAVKAAIKKTAKVEGDGVHFSADEDETSTAVAALIKAGAKVIGVERASASLEAAFLELTKGDGA